MCANLMRILLIASMGISGCSSTAINPHTVNSESPKPFSQITYPQIEETYIAGSRNHDHYANLDRQPMKSNATNNVSVNPSFMPIDYLIVVIIICTIELMLTDECILPSHEVRNR